MCRRLRQLLPIVILIMSCLFVPSADDTIAAWEANPPPHDSAESFEMVVSGPDGIFSATRLDRSNGLTAMDPQACALPAPTLIAPANGSRVNTLVPKFSWSGTAETDDYRIQVSTVSDFSSTVWDIWWGGLTNNPIEVQEMRNLSASTTYYWRVAPICQGDTQGAFSQAFTFSTEAITGPFLDAPSVIEPADGAQVSSTNVRFRWNDLAGALAYQLRFYTSYETAQADQHYMAWWSGGWYTSAGGTFDPNTTVYWRLLVRNDLGWGPLSPIRSFTTGSDAPTPDIALDATSWKFENNSSPFEPTKFWLSITAKSIGTVAASGVIVRFYLGDPNQGGVQIGADQSLGTIAAGGQAQATVEWTLTGNVDNQPLYARAFVSSDSNGTNNTVSKTVSIWFVPFRMDTDAYSFTNWGLEWQDILNDLTMFLDFNHPDDRTTALLLPVIYPFWSILLESGGHCYGMAATSSLYYVAPEIKPVPKDTSDMTRDEARSDIQYYHRTQSTHLLEAIMMKDLGSITSLEYGIAHSSIKNLHYPIMLLMQAPEGGHAVVAYQILDLGDEKRLYLYDNNRPLTTMSKSLYATVTSQNKTFIYDSPYGPKFDRFLARPALTTWPDTAEVIIERFYKWALSQVLRVGQIRIFAGPGAQSLTGLRSADASAVLPDELPAQLLVTDQYGRRIGYVAGSLVNEIPGASLIPLGNGTVLDVPADLRYVVSASGVVQGSMELSFLVPESPDIVRQVAYFDVPVSPGSLATVPVAKASTDWTLTNTGQAPQQPDALSDTRFYRTFLPGVTKSSP